MQTINKNLAVAPLVVPKSTSGPVRGLDLDDGQTNTLISTKLLINAEKYPKGTTLYFNADVVRLPQARRKFKLGELEFILLPEEMVVAFE